MGTLIEDFRSVTFDLVYAERLGREYTGQGLKQFEERLAELEKPCVWTQATIGNRAFKTECGRIVAGSSRLPFCANCGHRVEVKP